MQLHVFEYAVIRVVPRVEREEFINVGVILYCAKQKFLQVLFNLDKQRLLSLSPKLDLDELTENVNALNRICIGNKQSGPIGQLDLASRFRWLTATRSTVVQASKVHPGLCADANKTIVQLYEQLVL